MAATLSGLRGRVAESLADGDHLVWDEAALDEALRLALGEYRLAGGFAELAGLDGAAETTLAAAHESLIVTGAAGYAGSMRAVGRVESFDDQQEAAALVRWAAECLGAFRQMLAAVFPGYGVGGGESSGGLSAAERARLEGLRTSINPPWGSWEGEV